MYTLKLIDSKFTAGDAKEVLLTLINNKIHFHSNKNLCSEIRTGLSEEHSHQRIEQLEEAKKEIIALSKKAKAMNILLDVESSIHISGNPIEKKYQI